MMSGKNLPNTPFATEVEIMAKAALEGHAMGYLNFHPVHLDALFKDAGYTPTEIATFHDRAQSVRSNRT